MVYQDILFTNILKFKLKNTFKIVCLNSEMLFPSFYGVSPISLWFSNIYKKWFWNSEIVSTVSALDKSLLYISHTVPLKGYKT